VKVGSKEFLGKVACNFETGKNFRMQHYETENIILKEQLFSSEKTRTKELT